MNEIEIIAEIGVNHMGSVPHAHGLIEHAKNCGCDTVKFQLWDTEKVYPPERWAEMKKLELPRECFQELKAHAEYLGLRFLCTPDTYNDAVFLKQLGVERLKIGSSNVTNLTLLRAINELGVPVILSTGACTLAEMEAAVMTLRRSLVTIMHCVSAYPTPEDQLNLMFIRHLVARWHHTRTIGFSDHSSWGPVPALVALGLGARVFERHLTTSKELPGPDHKSSAEISEMHSYVEMLRWGARCIGEGDKRLMPCEVENRREYDRFVAMQRERSGVTC